MSAPRFVADDYGLAGAVNRGIEALAHMHRIDAVSIMAHRGADLSSLEQLCDSSVELGAHLVFVEEEPLLPSPVWSRFGGRFPGSYTKLFAAVLGNPSLLSAIAEEAEAQLARLRTLKVPLAFLNSHQHVHLFPPIWQALVSLFRRERLAVRVSQGWCGGPLKQSLVDASSTVCRVLWPVPADLSTWTPIGIDTAGKLDLQSARRWARRVVHDPRALELVLHPGREDSSLRRRYADWNYRWEREYALLESGDVHVAFGRPIAGGRPPHGMAL